MVLPYRDRTILDDAANLLIHHVKRQTGIQKGEKRRIKHLLRQFLPDLFFHPRQQVSDDEREEDGEISLNYLLLQHELFFSINFIILFFQKTKKIAMTVQIVRRNTRKMVNHMVA